MVNNSDCILDKLGIVVEVHSNDFIGVDNSRNNFKIGRGYRDNYILEHGQYKTLDGIFIAEENQILNMVAFSYSGNENNLNNKISTGRASSLEHYYYDELYD